MGEIKLWRWVLAGILFYLGGGVIVGMLNAGSFSNPLAIILPVGLIGLALECLGLHKR